MNKRICLLILLLTCRICEGQIICINCYNQNLHVLTDTNNLIVNGGFENSTCDNYHDFWDTSFCSNSLYYHCDILNWICTGGGISTYADICDTFFSTIVEGTKAVYFGNQFCNTCSSTTSDTSCINNIGCAVTGIPIGYPYNLVMFGGTNGVSLEQTVNGLTPGNLYALEFWSGGEWENNNFNYDGMFAVDVGFGNIFLRDPSTPPLTGVGRRYVIKFAAASSSHTIKFTNWGHICVFCTELILDDVRLFASNPCATEINELSQNIGTLYPNPINQILTVTTNTNSPSEIIIYDIASKKSVQKQFESSVSLNTAHLAKGIYLYQVRNKNGVIKKGKVVKE